MENFHLKKIFIASNDLFHDTYCDTLAKFVVLFNEGV